MARIDFVALTSPLAENDPCGPDLDIRGDEHYLNFVTIAEGLLPTEFFRDGTPFDVSAIDVDGQIARMAPLLGRTRDIRLLSLLARFLVLDRNLPGFTAVIEAIRKLLDVTWEEVHPRAEDGSFALRAAALATLNEPTVFIPLQYMPLCENRQFGVITYRARMYATGDVKPREGETAPSLPSILQALRECDTEHFHETRNLITRLAESLTRIHSLFAEHCGLDKAPRLEKVTQTVAGMMALLDEAVPSEDQKKIPASAGAEQTIAPGSIRSAFGARLALGAAIEYFRCSEPSSPVLPLIVQARELQGKTFVEVMKILVPGHAGNAAYSIGDQQVFALPLERLEAIMPSIDNYALQERESYSDTAPASANVASGVPPTSSQNAPEVLADSGSAGNSYAEQGRAELAPAYAVDENPAGDESASPALVSECTAMPATSPMQFTAATRKEAIILLNEVVQYLRAAEPSSPIPWLIDRAKALAERDFISILASVLPEGALREPGSAR